MSDLPTQGLLQQLNSNKVSGEHLEVLGKRAAALWCDGRSSSLNDAVVSTVKEAGLSPEQVKRVVEFANTSAYLTQFNKEGSMHRVVDFGSHGPANPSSVLQDLNDGGGGSTFDPGTGDYSSPPSTSKEASAWDEAAFTQMFGSDPGSYPEVNPLGDVVELREKLSSGYEQTTAMLTELEGAYSDLSEELFRQVKQAAMSGHSLSEVAVIWDQVAPSAEHVKVAFASIVDRLVDNGVFHDHMGVVDSLEKRASVGVVNPAHPLVVQFSDFCDVLTKLSEVRAMQKELGEGAAELTEFLKSAAGSAVPKPGLLQRGVAHLDTAGKFVGSKAQSLGNTLFGKKHWAANAMGTAGRIGTKYVAPALLANEVYRRTLKHRPGFISAKQNVIGAIPGTDAYKMKDYELQAAAQQPSFYDPSGTYGGGQW